MIEKLSEGSSSLRKLTPATSNLGEILMKRFRKYALISVGVLALALSGCGGSSDQPMEPPPPSAEQVAMGQLDTARANLAALSEYAPDAARLPLEQAVLAAAQALLTARTAADASASSVAAAQAQVTAAQAAVDATERHIADAMAAKDRMEAQQQKIQDARDALAMAETALGALSDTATDAERLAAQQSVVTAASAVVAALVEVDSMASLVDAARMQVTMAQGAADATQQRIDAAADVERERVRVAAEQEKIDSARAALSSASEMVAELEDYAPDTVRIELEKAVVAAAQGVVDALEAAAIEVAQADLTTAMEAVTMAQGVVDATQMRIDDEAARQQALQDQQERIEAKRMALMQAQAAVAELEEYTPDAVRIETERAVRMAAQELVDELEAANAPSSEVDEARQDVAAADTAIAATQARIDDAMAAEEERQRVAMETEREMGEIAAAREELMTAKTAFAAVADDALLAERTAARQAVLAAANMVVMELEEAMYYDVSVADITMARVDAASAQQAYDAEVAGGKFADEQLADARKALMDLPSDATDADRAAVIAEVLRTLALEGNADETPTKQEMLYQAQAALAALPADATSDMKLAEQQKVLAAAKAWKMELEEADAAHSMVMMAQAEIDAAQMAVDMTMAMRVRGTQIAINDDGTTNVDEANNLAAAVRGASGARDGGEGFDQTVSGNEGTANTVTIARRGPNSMPTWTLNSGDGTDGSTAAGMDLAGYSDKYVVRYDSDDKAVRADVPAPQPAGTGWYGHQWWAIDAGSKATDVADDMETGRVVVYSNIGPGTHVRLDAAATVVNTVFGVDSVTAGVVAIDETEATTAAKNGAFGSTFPTEPETFKEYLGEDDGDTEVKENEFKGTFYGIPGMYQCSSSAACRAEVNADGDLTLTGDSLTFTPDGTNPRSRRMMFALSDADYLHFGFWLGTTDNGADPNTYELQTFAGGANTYGRVDAVEGSAAYAGKAAGIYVREESPDRQRGGRVGDATTGTFTASAELIATFGGDANTVTDDKYRISGTVKDFMNDAGRDLGWTVMLNNATTVSRDPGTGAIAGSNLLTTGAFSGTTTGDGTAAMGSWNGQFFGPGSDDIPAVVVLPSGVAGEFDANFNDGYVAGAFGAGRDD